MRELVGQDGGLGGVIEAVADLDPFGGVGRAPERATQRGRVGNDPQVVATLGDQCRQTVPQTGGCLPGGHLHRGRRFRQRLSVGLADVPDIGGPQADHALADDLAGFRLLAASQAPPRPGFGAESCHARGDWRVDLVAGLPLSDAAV